MSAAPPTDPLHPEAGTRPDAGTLRGKRVLIADDEPAIRECLAFLLGHHGIDVACAADGDAALEAIHARPPDLVILDVVMPGTDGHQVCRAVRADPATARMPVIMLSARDGEAEQRKGLAMGADDYVTKPFSTRDLLRRVEARLRAQ